VRLQLETRGSTHTDELMEMLRTRGYRLTR
jgi:hypothetical protein